jgi:hypothetical protein
MPSSIFPWNPFGDPRQGYNSAIMYFEAHDVSRPSLSHFRFGCRLTYLRSTGHSGLAGLEEGETQHLTVMVERDRDDWRIPRAADEERKLILVKSFGAVPANTHVEEIVRTRRERSCRGEAGGVIA